MFANQTHYFKDGLDQTYAFTASPMNGASHRQGIYPCKTYARQTLRGIADNHFGADPFHYKLADLWLDVFQKPWAVPRSLDNIIDDLAVKIANHELFVYLADSPLWHADVGAGAGGGESSGGDASRASSESDQPRVQTGADEPTKAFVGPVPVTAAAARATATTTAKAAASTSVATLVAGATTFVGGMLYSSALGKEVNRVSGSDGTLYTRQSSDLDYQAEDLQGNTWRTQDPQQDMEYRTWLANGGNGSLAAWVADGKPSKPEEIKQEAPSRYVQQSPVDFDHVLRADYTKKGKPTGGHTLLYGDVRIVPGTESAPDVAGVYKATIQVPDPANPGQWITKTSFNSNNTMFPKDWDEARVKTEVNAAWNDPNKVVQGDKWTSVTPSGVKVEGWISPRTTVYPVYQKPKAP